MSAFTDCWLELYSAQTEVTGLAYTATVGGISGRAIMGQLATSPKLALAAFEVEGAITFQMLVSSFSKEPKAQCDVEMLGVPNLFLESATENNGVWYFTAADRTKR